MTNDTEWICIHIWQHKLRDECNKSSKYKCFGCTESGEKRERKEGKIYRIRVPYLIQYELIRKSISFLKI